MDGISKLVLILLVALAAGIDLRKGKIPNRLLLTGAGIALLRCLVVREEQTYLDVLWGMGAAFFLLYPFFHVHLIGAGDVKLLMMIGMFLGAAEVLQCLTVTVLVGGGYALYLLVRHRDKKRPVRLAFFVLLGLLVCIVC